MIKLLIFDVGGVIDTFDESMYIGYISQMLNINPIKFRDALIPLLDKLEVGRLSLPYMINVLSKEFKVSKASLEWDSAFERINKVNWDVVKLINRLSRRYRIAVLTNVSRSRHTVKMERYLKKVRYERIFASCYIGMAKPDPKIYRYVLDKMRVEPNEAIFIDNLENNTEGAKRVGIKSINFIGYDDLVKRLGKLGIK